VDLPASSLNELAERTFTDQSSVSVVVKRLIDRKLVARKKSAADARRIELSLTAAGRRLLARCPEPTQLRLLGALRRLSPGELTGLASALQRLVHEMGIDDSAPRMLFEEETPARRARLRSQPRQRARRA
jgi:DNA-binding MarR family transcriptional regulator